MYRLAIGACVRCRFTRSGAAAHTATATVAVTVTAAADQTIRRIQTKQNSRTQTTHTRNKTNADRRRYIHHAGVALSATHASIPLTDSVTPTDSTTAAAESTPHPFHFDMLVDSIDTFSSFTRAFRSDPSTLLGSSPIPPSSLTVVVAVSGGVDSAVTAQMMVDAKVFQRVVAIHMRNWDEIEERGRCSGEKDAKDAVALCAELGIPLEMVDYSREYFNDVFQELLRAYARGDTPSPDVLCNRIIKFHLLLQHVKAKYGEHAILATGHYARIRHPDKNEQTQGNTNQQVGDISSASTSSASSVAASSSSSQLFIGLDPRKDQSYFLSSVSCAALASCVFPLGWMQKSFIKRIAAQWTPNKVIDDQTIDNANETATATATLEHLPATSPTSSRIQTLSSKKESMGICFIGKRSMHSFLGEYIPLHSGPYIDIDTGAVIAHHAGWEAMTVGQRAAIGGMKQKYYVCAKTPESVQGMRAAESGLPMPTPPYAIYVCATRDHPSLYYDSITVDEVRWIDRPLDDEVDCFDRFPARDAGIHVRVKIRSSPGTVEATIHTAPAGVTAHTRVTFQVPQFAVASGQTCVFYDTTGTRCMGEGRIIGGTRIQPDNTTEAQTNAP